jgi:hypothetical protein
MSEMVGEQSSNVVLIRHPDVQTTKGMCYGQLDVPVDEAHLKVVSERITSDISRGQLPRPTQVVTSPSQRGTIYRERCSTCGVIIGLRQARPMAKATQRSNSAC